MDKQREQLIEKMLKEMFLAFRSMRPEHDHNKEHQSFGHRLAGFKEKFGQGHRELFMRLMKEKEGISVKEIAESLKITPGAVTQLVDKAVEMEVVTRQEDAIDRRIQKIKLSAKARERANEFRKLFIAKAEPKLSNLTDQELSQLTTLLGKINQAEEKTTA